MRRFCPASEEKMRPAGADFQELFAGIVQGAARDSGFLSGHDLLEHFENDG
jgi:hypothetical protein